MFNRFQLLSLIVFGSLLASVLPPFSIPTDAAGASNPGPDAPMMPAIAICSADNIWTIVKMYDGDKRGSAQEVVKRRLDECKRQIDQFKSSGSDNGAAQERKRKYLAEKPWEGNCTYRAMPSPLLAEQLVACADFVKYLTSMPAAPAPPTPLLRFKGYPHVLYVIALADATTNVRLTNDVSVRLQQRLGELREPYQLKDVIVLPWTLSVGDFATQCKADPSTLGALIIGGAATHSGTTNYFVLSQTYTIVELRQMLATCDDSVTSISYLPGKTYAGNGGVFGVSLLPLAAAATALKTAFGGNTSSKTTTTYTVPVSSPFPVPSGVPTPGPTASSQVTIERSSASGLTDAATVASAFLGTFSGNSTLGESAAADTQLTRALSKPAGVMVDDVVTFLKWANYTCSWDIQPNPYRRWEALKSLERAEIQRYRNFCGWFDLRYEMPIDVAPFPRRNR